MRRRQGVRAFRARRRELAPGRERRACHQPEHSRRARQYRTCRPPEELHRAEQHRAGRPPEQPYPERKRRTSCRLVPRRRWVREHSWASPVRAAVSPPVGPPIRHRLARPAQGRWSPRPPPVRHRSSGLRHGRTHHARRSSRRATRAPSRNWRTEHELANSALTNPPSSLVAAEFASSTYRTRHAMANSARTSELGVVWHDADWRTRCGLANSVRCGTARRGLGTGPARTHATSELGTD